MLVLRQYQLEALENLWAELFKSSSALCVLPTAAGKTVIFTELIARSIKIKPDIKIVVLLDKVTLVNQTHEKLVKQIGEQNVGMYCGTNDKYDIDKNIIVASIQSIHDAPLDNINLIILDEAHVMDQEKGRHINFIKKYSDKNPKLKVVGFTATPFRAAGGFIYGEDKLFKKVTFKAEMSDLIAQGYLVKPVMKKVEHQFDTSQLSIKLGDFAIEDVNKLTENALTCETQVKDALPRLVDRKKIVWMCSSIDHAEIVKDSIDRLGEKSAIIHSKMSQSEQEKNKSKFENEDARHLVFVTIVSTGYDYPPVDAIAMLRPTRSPVLYVQSIGRTLRLHEGKKDALILDYGRVVENCGPIDDPIISSGAKGRKIEAEKKKMKFCPNCLSYIKIEQKECGDCGYQFEQPKKPKLDDTPNRNVNILKSEVRATRETIKVRCLTLHKHKSIKDGKFCLKIAVYEESFLSMPVNFFYKWDNHWIQQKAYKILMQLGVEPKNSIDEQILEKPKFIPTFITYEKSKFNEIKGMSFDRTRTTEPNLGLLE